MFELAARVTLVSRDLRVSPETNIIRSQVIRSATSTAANYRAACRAQTAKVFITKVSIAAEEADETLFWLRLLVRLDLTDKETARPLAKEVDEIVRILAASKRTAVGNLKRKVAKSSKR